MLEKTMSVITSHLLRVLYNYILLWDCVVLVVLFCDGFSWSFPIESFIYGIDDLMLERG
jgi:hypothetical protein